MENITLDEREDSLVNVIPPYEGALRLWYGRIRQGKTYAATKDAFETLKAGQVVYTNWELKFETYFGGAEYDERKVPLERILGMAGMKRHFLVVPRSNYHFIDIRDLENVYVDGKPTGKNFYDWFAGLTSCSLYLDEGHIYYDSYLALKMDLARRISILNTGHFDRSVNIVTQRPTGIHAVLRDNVNIFYKCEKLWELGNLKRFQITEFQDIDADGRPNEDQDEEGNYVNAVSQDRYFSSRKIFESYESKYMRHGMKESQDNNAHWVDMDIKQAWKIK